MDYLTKNNENIRKLNTLLWEEQVAQSYKELSAFTHTSGKKGSFNALRLSNTIVFSERAIEYIVECLLRVIKVAAMGRVAMFPMAVQPVDVVRKFGLNGPIMGWLDEDQVTRIRRLFTPGEIKVLRQISADDPDTASRMRAVSKRKDLTDEELIRDLEKYFHGLTEEDRANFLRLTEGNSMARGIALVMARNKAFMRCSIPVLNEHFLGLINLRSPTDSGGG